MEGKVPSSHKTEAGAFNQPYPLLSLSSCVFYSLMFLPHNLLFHKHLWCCNQVFLVWNGIWHRNLFLKLTLRDPFLRLPCFNFSWESFLSITTCRNQTSCSEVHQATRNPSCGRKQRQMHHRNRHHSRGQDLQTNNILSPEKRRQRAEILLPQGDGVKEVRG